MDGPKVAGFEIYKGSEKFTGLYQFVILVAEEGQPDLHIPFILKDSEMRQLLKVISEALGS